MCPGGPVTHVPLACRFEVRGGCDIDMYDLDLVIMLLLAAGHVHQPVQRTVFTCCQDQTGSWGRACRLLLVLLSFLASDI